MRIPLVAWTFDSYFGFLPFLAVFSSSFLLE